MATLQPTRHATMPYEGQRSMTPGLPPNPAFALQQQRSRTPNPGPTRGATIGSIDPRAYPQSAGHIAGDSSPTGLPYDYDNGPERECYRKNPLLHEIYRSADLTSMVDTINISAQCSLAIGCLSSATAAAAV